MGRYHMSWAISSIIGPSFGGFLALYFPSYRPVFLISGILTRTSLIIFGYFTRSDVENSIGSQVSGETLKLLKQFPDTMCRMFANKRVLIGSLSVFVNAFCHWGLITFVPFFAVSKSGFNEVSIGLALTANSLVMAVCLPIIGSVSDRVGRFLPIAVGLFMSVIAFGLMPLITAPWMLIAVMGVLGFCVMLEFPVSQAVTMEAMPLKDRTQLRVFGA